LTNEKHHVEGIGFIPVRGRGSSSYSKKTDVPFTMSGDASDIRHACRAGFR